MSSSAGSARSSPSFTGYWSSTPATTSRARNRLAALDAVVIVTADQTDTAISADRALDHLRSTGRVHLADNAVTVISAATPRTHRHHRDRLVEPW